MKIAAGIVLYNPEIDRFEACINSLMQQVDKVYVFDNSEITCTFEKFSIVSYLTDSKNMGIAYALNRIMEEALKDGYDWVITMDQDSIVPKGMVDKYREVIESNSNLGIVCPQVIDIRRSYMEVKKEPETEFVDFCITSASCTSISAWKKVGQFDEWLFIDLVDNDFCKRLSLSGYRILRLNELVLNQEFGKIIPKSERCQKFWINVSKILHNQNFAKFSYKKFVSPMRVYYTCRNILYLNKKFSDYGGIGYKHNYNCNSFIGFLICFVIPSILRSNNKIETTNAVIKGFNEGKNKNTVAWKID